MCGRYGQYRTPHRYAEQLGLPVPPIEVGPRYNVPPRSRCLVVRMDGDQPVFAMTPWGYAPHWAGKRPPSINARVETAATKPYFCGIWKSGRCLVPADSWYEWKRDPHSDKVKQPYLIHLKSDQPMFFAGIGQFTGSEHDGFVIVTADSDEGMVDIHDRRPVVLPPDVAREWLDPGLLPERAEDLAIHHATPVDAFEWYPVQKAIGNVRNEGEHLIARETEPLA
ncbi:SOS response-associated peptidase [Pseudomonas sp. Marseille-QA0892]